MRAKRFFNNQYGTRKDHPIHNSHISRNALSPVELQILELLRRISLSMSFRQLTEFIFNNIFYSQKKKQNQTKIQTNKKSPMQSQPDSFLTKNNFPCSVHWSHMNRLLCCATPMVLQFFFCEMPWLGSSCSIISS